MKCCKYKIPKDNIYNKTKKKGLNYIKIGSSLVIL